MSWIDGSAVKLFDFYYWSVFGGDFQEILGISGNFKGFWSPTESIYPESESDPGLNSRYNFKRGESQGHTHSIYPESESDPGLDLFYNFKLGEPYILE